MKRFLYTTREGEVWTVQGCVPLPHGPGFWLGYRERDHRQVIIHEHRSTELPPAQPATTKPNTDV